MVTKHLLKGFNGAIFENDDELADAMLRALNLEADDKQQNFHQIIVKAKETSKLKLLERNNVRA